MCETAALLTLSHSPAAGGMRHAQRRAARTLRIATGLVRLRDARVVDRPGVVAVVEIGVQQRQRGVRAGPRIPHQLAAHVLSS